MSVFKLIVTLYRNLLTKQEDDYTARPAYTGTLYNSDLAALIAAERSEYRAATIENILRIADEAKAHAVAGGKIVIDGMGQYSMQVRGSFKGKAAAFDPDCHQLVVNFSAGKALREQLDGCEVETRPFTGGGPVVNLVSDPTRPGTRDVLSFRGMVLVAGSHLALRGDSPDVGVTFTPVDPDKEASGPVFIPPEACVPNVSTKLQFVLPADVTPGQWRVTVTSQYSGSSTLTNEPRSHTYGLVVTVR